MPARTSARSSTKRNQAASPPKPSRASQSPRRTRTTRSQSKDLGESDGVSKRQIRRGRGTSAGSEDSVSSVGSRTSKASSRGGRTRKAARGAVHRDLSIVAEDRDEIDEEQEDDEDDNADDFEPNKAQHPQSPGARSNISGTTAVTSHSAVEMAGFDPPQMAKILPELLESSVKILNFLAPAGTTPEIVTTAVNELKDPESRRAKILRYEEARFNPSREYYGTDTYIKSSFVLRKLLGENYEEGNFRPDAIIHVANLAVLVKQFLVTPKESHAIKKPLSDMTGHFPEPFVNGFDDTMQYGSSALVDESFALGLDIRTQWTIYNLFNMKGHEGSELEDLLVDEFFEDLTERTSTLSTVDDFLQHGQPKNVLGGGPANSEDQDAMVIERVSQIYGAFNEGDDAAEQDDLVDFDLLDEQFGWSDFLAELIGWSRARLNEISSSIKQQGGIQTITKALIDTMNIDDRQLGVAYEPPPTIMRTPLLPSLDIIPGASGNSLYDGKKAIRRLKKMKKSMSLGGPSSNQKATAPSSSRPTEPKNKQKAPVKSKAPAPYVEDDYGLEDDQFEVVVPKPTQVYAEIWRSSSDDKNKENRPLKESLNLPAKRRLVDPHPDARRRQWHDDESQEGNGGPSNRKRSHEDADEESESEGTEDHRFEQDQRVPDPSRRVVPAPEPASKRHRKTSPEEEEAASRRSRERAVEQLQVQPAREKAERQSARRERERRDTEADNDDEFFEDEDEEVEDEGEGPIPFSQVATAVKVNNQRNKTVTAQTQKRTSWSDADSQRLITLIEEYGCSWSFIQKRGGFEVDRDQVALKDKARNLRVTFEKARVRLPTNFEKIALGAKELRSIRAARPNYKYNLE